MSTDYSPNGYIPFERLFDGRMAVHGLKEPPDSVGRGADGARCLEDSSGNRVWFYPAPDGNAHPSVYGGADPTAVFDAVRREFGVELVGEHDAGPAANPGVGV